MSTSSTTPIIATATSIEVPSIVTPPAPPTPISFEGRVFFAEKELIAFDPVCFYGCSRARSMIQKKQLVAEVDYIAAASIDPKTKVWMRQLKTYKRAKLIVSKEWVLRHVPRMRTIYPDEGNEMPEIVAQSTDAVVENAPKACPPLLFIEEEEKFKDNSGNTVDIEVRGERNAKKCYFKVADVAAAFKMPTLDDATFTPIQWIGFS